MFPLIYHASYSRLVLPTSHPFPITKYAHLRQYLLENDLADESQLIAPPKVDAAQIATVHDPAYVDAFLSGSLSVAAIRRLGFPWSDHLVTRTLYSLGGSLLTAALAMDRGIAVHLAGGYHHAHFNFGSGYCVFNDLVLAAKALIDSGRAERVMIVDCDVHQGDGTATLCQNMDDVVTLSFHCENNFPSRKPASDYDVPLPRNMGDDAYLTCLDETLSYLIRLEKPDAIIYDAGVDIHSDDKLGYLDVSTNGILARDLKVLSLAKEAAIPIAAVIGGGYSAEPSHLSERHSQLVIAANRLWRSDG